ncbi:ATP-grasp fold amidoligase family protein [Caballeronia sp. INDeC2]|uniref:ATP-grasp fold amidoligase family protein n=1 Tax=Caballeronia sp. INDeC2 TaxID=2921747 RepID=UPI0020284EE5|nr:ATP-grasp fold amidoligase family protein [Caballeronia sp. INDeC2]
MTLSKSLIHSVRDWLPDNLYLTINHRRRIGRFPRMRNPTTFNEKILRRCLEPDPRFGDLSDKLKVREYVAEKIGSEYLVPLVAEPSAFTRSVFDALPSSFVMKANHGSGFVYLVKDKNETSFEKLDAMAQSWLSTDFYAIARERHYRTIERRIFFEALLTGAEGKVPPDLKFHVFNKQSGDPKIFILVIADRFGEHPRGDMYDADWNLLDIGMGHYSRSTAPAPRPKNLDALVSIARTLASDFEFVRVDLYDSNDEIYFGELTFTPGAGMFPLHPDRVDYEWGNLM